MGFQEGAMVCEMWSQYTCKKRRSGEEYKVWSFTGWSTLPVGAETFKKGKWLHVRGAGERYNLDTLHEIKY